MVVIKFVHPSTILVAGPTGCGKTNLVYNLIVKDMFEPKPQRIVWIYSEWQDFYSRLKEYNTEIDFRKEVSPDLYDSIKPNIRNLIVVDDKMSEAGNSKVLSRFFTEGSHHRNLSIIYIVQNLFDKGKSHRTISINSQYFIVFKNPRDKLQIGILSRQMFGDNGKYLVDVFIAATKEPYTFLLIDLRPDTPEELRLRTNIFPGDTTQVYIKR